MNCWWCPPWMHWGGYLHKGETHSTCVWTTLVVSCYVLHTDGWAYIDVSLWLMLSQPTEKPAQEHLLQTSGMTSPLCISHILKPSRVNLMAWWRLKLIGSHNQTSRPGIYHRGWINPVVPAPRCHGFLGFLQPHVLTSLKRWEPDDSSISRAHIYSQAHPGASIGSLQKSEEELS